MSYFTFLTTNDLSPKAIWAWARKLVQDLEKVIADVSVNGMIPSGSVQTYAGENSPAGWLMCDGGLYSKFDYPKLFNAIGYQYGGGGDNFNVPDFRDRFLIGAGGLLSLGQSGGAAQITLKSENLPVDGASFPAKSLDSLDLIDTSSEDQLPLTGKMTNQEADAKVTVDLGGKSAPIDIIPPAVGVNIIIKA